MEIIEVNGNDYKVIYKENEVMELSDYGLEKVIAYFNGAIYRLIRRFEETWEEDKCMPTYKTGEWTITELCKIEDLK